MKFVYSLKLSRKLNAMESFGWTAICMEWISKETGLTDTVGRPRRMQELDINSYFWFVLEWLN
jgi:hypothetical protein